MKKLTLALAAIAGLSAYISPRADVPVNVQARFKIVKESFGVDPVIVVDDKETISVGSPGADASGYFTTLDGVGDVYVWLELSATAQSGTYFPGEFPDSDKLVYKASFYACPADSSEIGVSCRGPLYKQTLREQIVVVKRMPGQETVLSFAPEIRGLDPKHPDALSKERFNVAILFHE